MVLAALLNAYSVTSARPVLLQQNFIGVKEEEGSISAFVLPGLGLKWKCDQLCVESQSFFMLPATE